MTILGFGPFVLGRTSIPETGVYSVCCAIQNLWLAARAEGIRVGWVSILSNQDLQRILLKFYLLHQPARGFRCANKDYLRVTVWLTNISFHYRSKFLPKFLLEGGEIVMEAGVMEEDDSLTLEALNP
jgi:hypothetical protein